ncbi:GNAT family N-acetyltransferase [Acuticoccus sp. MNP-M23]|uniref:GNAT family N-acetyltransferase n=1 Tax=Acuticoccus sp. MNP-M23 TaxID=3072793 RepID=UPI0028155932|nr:GNAT family N-acetyltransferase [Acuticoccus sp. MNP-M23]WMS41112.1 GNAT family N-acetyltransferase [Acuticoccus sp. MNP-M23]
MSLSPAIFATDDDAARRAAAEAVARGPFMMPQFIRTRRLTLTLFARHHLEPFSRLVSDPETGRFLGGQTDRAGVFDRMARMSGAWRIYGFGIYALTDAEGVFVGYAGLWFPHDRPEIEIAYGLMPEARGMGLAIEAVSAICATAEACGVNALVSYVAPDNEASRRVAEAAGATRDGTLPHVNGLAEVWRYPVAARPAPANDDGVFVDASVMPLRIRTRRLMLCPWQPDHFDRFAAHLADERTTRFLAGPQSYGDATRAFFALAGQWLLRGYGMYAVEADGRFVGTVGLYHPQNSRERELVYSITADARRLGYAAEAAKAVRDVAAAQGLDRLVSYIDPANAGSIAIAEKLGAVHEGDVNFTGLTDMVWAYPVPGAGSELPAAIKEIEPA